jgi:hypothetical protein
LAAKASLCGLMRESNAHMDFRGRAGTGRL